ESVMKRLSATIAGTPNFFTLRMWRRRFSEPRCTAAGSAVASRSFLTPPCIFSARSVATMIAASGLSPANRHLMSKNFSAPRSAPNPPSVSTMSASARPSLVATSELQPCAMLPNGPQCTRAGPPSSVWTRFGLIASLSSSVMAPCALRSLARTALLSPRSATIMRARRVSRSCSPVARARIAMISEPGMMTYRPSRARPALHPELRAERRLAHREDGVLAETPERLRDTDRDGGFAFARGRGVDAGDEDEPALGRARLEGAQRDLRFVSAVQLHVVVGQA